MKSPYSKDIYQDNAVIYKILANPIRLEILNILKIGEATVEELTVELGLRKANVSQHLTLLRAHGLVKPTRNGLNVRYAITDPRIVEPCRILAQLRGALPL